MSVQGESIHATALIVGGAGVLIRGASGAGKSRLALALLAGAPLRGDFARLIGDDRVRLTCASGRVIASGHGAVAGLIERRGSGLESAAHETGAVVHLVVDLVETIERLPDAAALKTRLLGVALPRLALARGAPPAEQCADVLARLEAIRRR